MNVSVSQSLLSQAISIVSHAVSARVTLTILENIRIATEEGKICLSTTNLELSVKYWIDATINEEGSITVPAKIFSDLVNTLPDAMVDLKLNVQTQTLQVRCLQLVTDIKGMDASEFPPLPDFEAAEAVSFEMQGLREAITQVAFAAALDESRPVLHGVKMTVNGNEMEMAATDGFRVAIKRTTLKESIDNQISAIIPATALRELVKIAGTSEKSVQVMLSEGNGQIIFHLKDCELASLLISGQFVNYDAIVPKSFRNTAVISTASLKKACSQAGVIARDNKNLIKLDIKGTDDGMGKIGITAQSEQTGFSENYIEAAVDGEDISIAFNVRFVLDALDVITTENVALQTNANMSPAMIQPMTDNQDYQYVIMPMHFG